MNKEKVKEVEVAFRYIKNSEKKVKIELYGIKDFNYAFVKKLISLIDNILDYDKEKNDDRSWWL